MEMPTPKDIAYQRQHIHDSGQHAAVTSNVAGITLASIAIILRIIARRMTRTSLQKDDWMIFAALAFAIGYVTMIFIIVHLGGMKHVITMKHPIAVAKLTIAIEACYSPAICCVKLSYLMLYYRLFPNRRLRIACWSTGAVITCYTIISFFSVVFVCRPVRAAWDPTVVDPTCIDINLQFIIFAIFNVVTDIVILIIPLPILWRLHLSKGRKLQLIGVFLTGGFVTIVSIYRVPHMKLARQDASYVDVPAAVWSAIEVCVGIVSACLPTLRPLVTQFSTYATTKASQSSSYKRSKSARSSGFQDLEIGNLRTPDATYGQSKTSRPKWRPLMAQRSETSLWRARESGEGA